MYKKKISRSLVTNFQFIITHALSACPTFISVIQRIIPEYLMKNHTFSCPKEKSLESQLIIFCSLVRFFFLLLFGPTCIHEPNC